MGGGDQRAHLDTGRQTRPDLEFAGARRQAFDQSIGHVADRDGDRDRHAALARRTVGGTDQCVDGLVEVDIGHDDEVVLGTAERLDALAGGATGSVDGLGHGCRANEADRGDARIVEQGIDGCLVAVEHVEDARRQAGLGQ